MERGKERGMERGKEGEKEKELGRGTESKEKKGETK